MEKKHILYSFAVMLPASILVLYFGLVFATRSFQGDYILFDDETCIIDDDMRDYVVTTHTFLDTYDEFQDPETSRMHIESYLRHYVQTSGATDCIYKYLPNVIDYCGAGTRSFLRRRPKQTIRRPGAPAQIRPKKAHNTWKRLQTQRIFRWPVHPKNFWLSSYYGPRTLHGRKGFHKGVDLAARTGTPVIAAAAGTIIEAKYAPGYGNYVMIDHKNGYKTRYAHLSRIIAKVGQRVSLGQLIGKVGATGKVTKNKSSKSASHLHFEVYRNGKHVNPFKYLA